MVSNSAGKIPLKADWNSPSTKTAIGRFRKANSCGFGCVKPTFKVTMDGVGTNLERSEDVINTVFLRFVLLPTKSMLPANSDLISLMFRTMGCSLKLTMSKQYGNAMNLYIFNCESGSLLGNYSFGADVGCLTEKNGMLYVRNLNGDSSLIDSKKYIFNECTFRKAHVAA